jgi:hypothetical protein
MTADAASYNVIRSPKVGGAGSRRRAACPKIGPGAHCRADPYTFDDLNARSADAVVTSAIA